MSESAQLPEIPAQEIAGASAWYGRDLAQTDEWIYGLSRADIDEIESAMRASEQAGVALAALDADAFPLPQLGSRLQSIRDELLVGRGFALLRGLPVARYTIAEAARAYLGLGAHIGKAVSQNAAGHLLGHIIDLGREEDDPTARIYQTHARQFYHADSCDIVGLLCLKKAKRGGTSTIVSSVTLFNEMKRRHPDLVAELFATFHVDRRGEVPAGRNPWFECPVFNWYEGLLSTYYVRRYIFSSRRFEQVPPLTQAQIAACDAFDAIAEEDDVHLKMDFETGRYPVIAQPSDPARSDRIRRLAGATAAPAPAAPLAMPTERPPAPKGLRGSLGINYGGRPRRHHRSRRNPKSATRPRVNRNGVKS